MEPRPNFHPVYVSGQYLTSEHLNDTQSFLWQEEKAGRYILAGNGIVGGFNPDFGGTPNLQNVSLTAGGGGTVDGYLVKAPANILFDRGVNIDLTWFKLTDQSEQVLDKLTFDKIKATLNPVSEKTLNAIELIADNTAAADLPTGNKTLDQFAITNAQALANWIMLAVVFIKDLETKHCQQGDCNSKGIQRTYVTRYFLVQNNQFPTANTSSPEMPTCSVTRIKNLSGAGSPTGLNNLSFTAWNAGSTELLAYFSNTPSGKQLSIIGSLLDADDQALLNTAIGRFTQINASVNSANCPQYYCQFAADLALAINELVVFYNDYIRHYPSIDPNRIERTIIIGSLRSTGVDKWRYYFIPAAGQAHLLYEKKKLKQLFRRALAMVNHFYMQAEITTPANSVDGKPLAIPTLTGDALLQNRAIPYYFNVMQPASDHELLKYWNPQGGNLKNIFCYYDTKLPSRSDMAGKLATTEWYNHNFFRIEGHIGMAKATAMSAINALIVNHGLPIQLIDCDVNYKGPKKWNDWYAEFAAELEGWVPKLRKDFTKYDYAPIKNIQTRVAQTSYRNVNEMAKIANDFYAYSSLFYNTVPPQNPDPAKKMIPGEAYIRFKSTVPKERITSVYDKFKEALAEQTELQAQKLVTLKDLTDIEYMGGAPRGGTFVLLHNGTNIIGDGCLPYYYRINQVRVFSA